MNVWFTFWFSDSGLSSGMQDEPWGSMVNSVFKLLYWSRSLCNDVIQLSNVSGKIPSINLQYILLIFVKRRLPAREYVRMNRISFSLSLWISVLEFEGKISRQEIVNCWNLVVEICLLVIIERRNRVSIIGFCILRGNTW